MSWGGREGGSGGGEGREEEREGGREGGREKSILHRPRNDSTKGTHTQLEIKEGSL